MSYKGVVEEKMLADAEASWLEEQIDRMVQGLAQFRPGQLGLELLNQYIQAVDGITHIRAHMVEAKLAIIRMTDKLDKHDSGEIDLNEEGKRVHRRNPKTRKSMTVRGMNFTADFEEEPNVHMHTIIETPDPQILPLDAEFPNPKEGEDNA